MKGKTVRNQASSEKMMPKEDSTSLFKPQPRAVMKSDTLSEQVACSKVCVKNYKWKEADEDFPMEPWLRKVDKYYPFAFQGKGLLIDEPKMADDIRRCEKKRDLLEKHGYRYLIIKNDSTLHDLLEEAQSWHGPRS